MWSNWDGPNQKWTLDSKQRLVSVNSGQCLDVYGSGNSNGTSVIQFPCHDGNNQKWILDNLQRLHPAHAPDKCLNDLSGPQDIGNGAELKLWDCYDLGYQKWNINAAPQ